MLEMRIESFPVLDQTAPETFAVGGLVDSEPIGTWHTKCSLLLNLACADLLRLNLCRVAVRLREYWPSRSTKIACANHHILNLIAASRNGVRYAISGATQMLSPLKKSTRPSPTRSPIVRNAARDYAIRNKLISGLAHCPPIVTRIRPQSAPAHRIRNRYNVIDHRIFADRAHGTGPTPRRM
jgi:hypothetical protein